MIERAASCATDAPCAAELVASEDDECRVRTCWPSCDYRRPKPPRFNVMPTTVPIVSASPITAHGVRRTRVSAATIPDAKSCSRSP